MRHYMSHNLHSLQGLYRELYQGSGLGSDSLKGVKRGLYIYIYSYGGL